MMQNNKVTGKEFVTDQGALHKSQESLPVVDVMFEDDAEVAGRYNVLALTTRGRVPIGTIDREGQWVGSRDLIGTKDGAWVRPFMAVSSAESVSEAKRAFTAHWKGTRVFVHPTLPTIHKGGDIHLLGGESVSIQAWLDQSVIWMELALALSNGNLPRLNIAFIMAGYAMELVFKSLAWSLGSGMIRPVHEVRHFYGQLDAGVQREIGSLARQAGWESAEDLLSYIDDFLNPVHRRYFGISPTKEFQGLNIDGKHKLVALGGVHRKLRGLVDELIKPPL